MRVLPGVAGGELLKCMELGLDGDARGTISRGSGFSRV